MILTINRSSNPHNGLNVAMRSLEKTGLTKHKIGGFKPEDYLYDDIRLADLVIFGNYLPEDIQMWRQNLPARVKIGYLFCSPLGQASCNGEIPLLGQLLHMLDDSSCKLDYLFCSDLGIPHTLRHKRVIWLPVVSDFEGQYCPIQKRSGILLMGNNLRPNRNFANQLAALRIAQRDLGVSEPIFSYFMPHDAHVYLRDMFGIERWANYIDPITEDEKVKIIAQSKLGLQITYSDSFNIAAYEHGMCHVPCLTNSTLTWVPENLRVTKLDSPGEISEYIKKFLTMSLDKLDIIGHEFNEAARTEMKDRYAVCNNTLRECL